MEHYYNPEAEKRYEKERKARHKRKEQFKKILIKLFRLKNSEDLHILKEAIEDYHLK